MEIPLGHAADHLMLRAKYQWTAGKGAKRLGGTPIWLGPPGMAKSALQVATMQGVASQLGASLLIWTVQVADREPIEIKGTGVPSRNLTTNKFDRLDYTRSGILPSPEMEEEYDHIFLQLDELSSSTPDHMKVCASIILDYRIGEHYLDPSKYFVACTGNDVTHKSGAVRIPAHVINRMCVQHVAPDHRPWLVHAAKPEEMIPPLARAYVMNRPSQLTEVEIPPEANKAFATLRSLTLGVHDLLATFNGNPNMDTSDPHVLAAAFSAERLSVATAILSGYVGDGIANEFVSFARVVDNLTTREAIESDPEHAPLPKATELSAEFAQASYCIAWTDQKNMRAMLKYVMRMRKDLRVSTIVAMTKKVPQLMSTKEYGEMAKENSGLLMTTFTATAKHS